MITSKSNVLKIAETEIKQVDLRKKLCDLKRQLKKIDPNSFQENLSKFGKAPKGYISSEELKEDI